MPDLTGIIKIALVGILGALLVVSSFSSHDITINALDFSLGLEIVDQGYTVIDIPPLGTVRAQTHQFPLMFRISLKNINLERLSNLVAAEEPKSIFRELQAAFRRQVTAFLIRLIILSFVGGFGAGCLFFRSGKKALLSGLIGLLAFGTLLGSAVFTYDETAFREPEFNGIIEAAPWLLGVAEEALVAVKSLDEKIEIVSGNLLILFESLRYLGGGEGTVDGELKILHVSDFHNNPIGVSLARQLAVSFGVDLVIDTGDATDFGTPIEADLISGIDEAGLPWLFVPGNHDSPIVVEALEQLDNIHVLHEDVIYLEDLDFAVAGLADPAAQTNAATVRAKTEYVEAAAGLRRKIEQAEHKPSIIIAHHLWAVQEFSDMYAVLLHGHGHRAEIKVVGNALMIDAGTSGGAGIRGLMTRDELPFSMVLLHFNRNGDRWVAVAADVVTVHQLNAGFVLERHLLHQPQAPADQGVEEGEP